MKKILFAAAAFALAACAKKEEAPPAPPPPVAAAPAPAPKPEPKEIAVTAKSPEAVESFKKGRELMENMRMAEGAEHFKKALELDPGFAQARAFLGYSMPGAEGLKELEAAAVAAAALPEVEKLIVESMLADRRGEEAKAQEMQKKMAELAPTDWRVHWYLATNAQQRREWDGAISELKKATELNPKAGPVFNQLGYLYLQQERKDEAIVAFKKYAELNPTEPNPHDSLADALLAAGKLAEAEAAYLKAVEVSPAFHISWQGVAQTRFLRGDFAGGYAALGKAREMGARPIDKLGIDADQAWAQFAEGKLKDALKTVDAREKEAAAQKLDYVMPSCSLMRAAFLGESGKAQDGLKHSTKVVELAEKLDLPGATRGNYKRFGLSHKAWYEAKLGKVADAEKTLAALTEEAKLVPQNTFAQSLVALTAGGIALAKKDAKAAAEAFGKCIDEDSFCKWQHVMALEAAGDKPGAEAARKKILDTPRRETGYLFVLARLGAMPKPAPAPGAAK